MLHRPDALRRGVVVRHKDESWLVWEPSDLAPLCAPIRWITEPRTRTDYVIEHGDLPGFGHRRHFVRFEAARSINTTFCTMLEVAASADAINRMLTLLQRARESIAVEALRTMRT